MAYITTTRPPGAFESRGVQYTQSAGTDDDCNGSAAVLVPAVADHIGVIDELLLSSTAAEILNVRAGSDELSGAIHTVALASPVDVLPGTKAIRSDVANEAITLYAASSGDVFWTIWYHYEKKAH